ncbi:MAG: DnaJ domain-containing protein [Gammaproteobacteria bacterium]|nr:DnaJ domain-containing protein [Gammaproteobacteria bacterium]
MEYKDYYATLGLPRDADQTAIKQAYRRLARKYHPDVSEEPDAANRFKGVREAYEVLKDPRTRAAYDRLGSRWRAGETFQPPPEWAAQGHARTADFDFSEFFESLFGAAGRASAASSRGARQTGRSGRRRDDSTQERYRLEITLEEARQGGERTVRVPAADDERGEATRAIRVRIPPGVEPGQAIRLAGQGTRPGTDLYLELRLLPHRMFSLDGLNVCLDLPVTAWEAALGARIQVPTLGGPVALNLPAGVESGKRLRLKGRGLGARCCGDQLVTVRIVVPAASTDEQRALYTRLADEFQFNPRAGWFDERDAGSGGAS